MLRYKAGYKYVDGGVHAQVLDFPAAITCAGDLAEARRLLGIALVDVAEAAVDQVAQYRHSVFAVGVENLASALKKPAEWHQFKLQPFVLPVADVRPSRLKRRLPRPPSWER